MAVRLDGQADLTLEMKSCKDWLRVKENVLVPQNMDLASW